MTKYYTSIVPFEMAKTLKAVGYQEDCLYYYSDEGRWGTSGYALNWNKKSYTDCCSAPIYAEVFDWLLNKGLSVEIERNLATDDKWCRSIVSLKDNDLIYDEDFDTWHSAADAAILKAIEIITK